MSGFNVRRLSTVNRSMSNSIKQLKSLSISPQRAIFNNFQSNSISIIQFILKNDSNKLIEFDIVQPTSKLLKVKTKCKQINAFQSIQICLILNSQKCNQKVNDSFMIKCCKNMSISVPIFVNQGGQNINPRQLVQIKKHVSININSRNKGLYNINGLDEHKIDNLSKLILKKNPSQKQLGRILASRKIKRKHGEIMNPSKKKFNGIQEMVQAFLSRFSRTNNYLKEKEIRNEIFLGQKQIMQNRQHQIYSFNALVQFFADQLTKKQILERYETEYSQGGPENRTMLNNKLSWNSKKNEPKITLNRGMQKFHEQVRKIVVNYRFQKIHKFMTIYRKLIVGVEQNQNYILEPQTPKYPRNKINNQTQTMLISINKSKNNKIENHSDLSIQQTYNNRQLQQNEQIEKEIQDLKQKKINQYNWNKIKTIVNSKNDKKLGDQFNFYSLSPSLLDQSFSTDYLQSQHTFDIEPRVGFDNWIAMEESQNCIHQTMNYRKKQRSFQWQCHPLYKHHQFKNLQASVYQSLQSIQIENFKLQVKDNKNLDYLFDEVFTNNRQMTRYKQYNSVKQISPENLCEYESEKIVNKSLDEISYRNVASETIDFLQQDYIPYFTKRIQGQLSPVYSKINMGNIPALINQVQREDRIDFDKKCENLTNIKLKNMKKNRKVSQKKGLIQNKSGVKYQAKSKQKHAKQKIKQVTIAKEDKQYQDNIEALAFRAHKLQDNDQDDLVLYEDIIENIQRIKEKQLGSLKQKIHSYNKFTVDPQNQIIL